MPKEKINLKEMLKSYEFEYDLLQKIPCSEEDNKKYSQILKETGNLPEGIFAYEYDNDEFYTVYETDLSESEIKKFLSLKKLSYIKTIRNCVMFFTIITILEIIGGFILSMNIMKNLVTIF